MRLLFDWFCCLSCGQKWRRGCRMEQSKLSPHTPSSLNRRKKVEGILTFYFKFSNLAQVIYLSSQHCLHQRNVYAVFLVREGKKKNLQMLDSVVGQKYTDICDRNWKAPWNFLDYTNSFHYSAIVPRIPVWFISLGKEMSTFQIILIEWWYLTRLLAAGWQSSLMLPSMPTWLKYNLCTW